MIRKFSIIHSESGEESVARYEGRSRSVAIFGADSFIGFRMMASMAARGHKVYAYGEASSLPSVDNCFYAVTDYHSFSVPQECNVVLFCHDVANDSLLHQQALLALCDCLSKQFTENHQVHLNYFSSSNICEGVKGTIRENAPLHPHNLRELAVCQAEQTLAVWHCMTRGAIIPGIFRYGELYGDADDRFTSAGYVNECLNRARQGKSIVFSGNLNQKRSLTHVKDLADTAAAVIDQDFVSGTINIPGEKITVYDCLSAIAEQYGVEFEIVCDQMKSDNLLPFSADRVLASSLHKSSLPSFLPKHHFKNWVKTQAG